MGTIQRAWKHTGLWAEEKTYSVFFDSIISGFSRQELLRRGHDNCMSKQFVNDVVSIAILATCWHEVPMPPLEGEVPNEREAEGFVR